MLRRICFLLLLVAGCSTSRDLTSDEMSKLDARLQALLAGTSRSVSGEIDTSVRPDGEREYGVLIRGGSAEELRKAGINAAGSVGPILTARVTADELKALARIPSVRSVEAARLVSPNK